MLNDVCIMGRLTADPELKVTEKGGVNVTTFDVAVERNYAPRGEDRPVDFLPVVAWRKTAEFVTKNFRKGQMIAVRGAVQTRKYEDRDGKKRVAVEIVADNVYFCGSKAEASNSSTETRTSETTIQDDFSGTPFDDELPF